MLPTEILYLYNTGRYNQVRDTGIFYTGCRLQQTPGYNEFGYYEHPATTSLVTMSTRLQWVWLLRAPGYNEFGYYEHPATMSLVTMSTRLQWVWLLWAPSYYEFGYYEHPAGFFASKSLIAILKSLVTMSTHLIRGASFTSLTAV